MYVKTGNSLPHPPTLRKSMEAPPTLRLIQLLITHDVKQLNYTTMYIVMKIYKDGTAFSVNPQHKVINEVEALALCAMHRRVDPEYQYEVFKVIEQ